MIVTVRFKPGSWSSETGNQISLSDCDCDMLTMGFEIISSK